MFVTPWLNAVKSSLGLGPRRSRKRRQPLHLPGAVQVEKLEERTLLSVSQLLPADTDSLEMTESNTDDATPVVSLEPSGEPETAANDSATEQQNAAEDPIETPTVELPGMELVDPSVNRFNGQVIYLDFDGAEDVVYEGPVTIGPFDVPAFEAPGDLAGQEEMIITQVLERLGNTFAKTGLTFTAENPNGVPAHSTIYVGGRGTEFADYGDLLGVAEKMDVGNQDAADNAFYFSAVLGSGYAEAIAFAKELAGGIAHELGHLLGYAHDEASLDGSALSGLATTYKSAEGQSRTHYVTAAQGVSHKFIVDGIWGTSESCNYKWYSTYSGTSGEIGSGASWTGNNWIDPTISRTFSSAGTYWVRAKIWDRTWRGNTGDWRETHTWKVTVPQPNRAPTKPSNINDSNVTKNSAKVSWNPSSDPDGNPITYEFQYQKDDLSPFWSSSIRTSNTYVNLTGLSSDKSYHVRVKATDGRGGDSGWTPVNNLFRTRKANYAPTKPSNINDSNVTKNSAKVSWNPSSDPDGNPITYEFQYQKDDLSPFWSSSIRTSNTYVNLTGLSSDKSYHVRVKATDGRGGDSGWTPVNNLFTTKAAPQIVDIRWENATGQELQDGASPNTNATVYIAVDTQGMRGTNATIYLYEDDGLFGSDDLVDPISIPIPTDSDTVRIPWSVTWNTDSDFLSDLNPIQDAAPEYRLWNTTTTSLLGGITGISSRLLDVSMPDVRWEDAAGNLVTGTVPEGTTLYLAVSNIDYSATMNMTATIWEDDITSFNDEIRRNVPITYISGSKWQGSWVSYWTDDNFLDGIFGFNPDKPEYFFQLDTFGQKSQNVNVDLAQEAVIKIHDHDPAYGTGIPLVLIHGTGSDTHSSDLYRWETFRQQIDADPASYAEFDVYVWKHPTELPIGFNGAAGSQAAMLADFVYNSPTGLRLGKTDSPYANSKVVFVAHSQGGLVARSFMNHFNASIGHKQGDDVLGLLTLDTPHHGSPEAIPDWDAEMWTEVYGDNLVEFDKFATLVGPGLPFLGGLGFNSNRRGDVNLAWDSADGAVTMTTNATFYAAPLVPLFTYQLTPADANKDQAAADSTPFYPPFLKDTWSTLDELNESEAYASKLIAYGAYDNNLSDNASLLDVLGSAVEEHTGLSWITDLVSKMRSQQMVNGNFTSYYANDGMVPLQSSLFLDLTNDGAQFATLNGGAVTIDDAAITAHARPGVRMRIWSGNADGIENHLRVLDTTNQVYWATLATDIRSFLPGESGPIISDVPDRTINENGTTGPIGFTVSDAETPDRSLTVTKHSSNPTIVPLDDIVLGGSGANRTVTVTPLPNQNGPVTITLTVTDAGGLTDSDSFVVTVNPVNDPPSFTPGSNVVVNKDSGPYSGSWATNISKGPSNESSQAVTFEIVSNDNPSLFSTAPVLSSTGTLTFTPAANKNGAANLTVRLRDNGGTANGGSDTSTIENVRITVNPVNDAPTLTAISTLTGATKHTPFPITYAMLAAAANERDVENASISFELVSFTNGTMSVSPGARLGDGQTWTWTPPPNATGEVNAFMVKAWDGQLHSATPVQVKVNVSETNPPLITTTLDSTTYTENAAAVVIDGSLTVTDSDSTNLTGATVSIAEGFQASEDILEYPLVLNGINGEYDNATGVLTLTGTASVNTYQGALRMVKYRNSAENPNTANRTITFTATDGTNTSSLATKTVTITAVNDAPSFTKGPDQRADKNAGPQRVNGWATDISRGPADESEQRITLEVIDNTNPDLFAAGPKIDSSGNLTYTPADGATGSATITVRARDNGGTANGGVDVSPDQSFTITVTPLPLPLGDGDGDPIEMNHVRATFAKGVLDIRGDDRANAIEVFRDGNDLVVKSAAATTTVNGQSEFRVTNAIGAFLRLRIKMRRGDDVVKIEGLQIGGKAKINMGKGNDTLSIQDTDIATKLKIKSGMQNNTIGLDDVTIGGSAKISTSKGNDTIAIEDTTIAGNLKIKMRGGNDVVEIDDLEIRKKAKIDMGKGDDTIVIEGTRIYGNLKMKSKSGDDVFVVSKSVVDGKTKVKMSRGNNTFLVLDSDLFGKVNVKTSKGDDLFALRGSTFDDRVKIKSSSGDDDVALLDNEFNERVSGNMGKGYDRLVDTSTHVKPPKWKRIEEPLTVLPADMTAAIDDVIAQLVNDGLLDNVP